MEKNGELVVKLDNESVSYAVEKSCQAKAVIVAADEHERGQRALLNLGHTFGHALEAAAGYNGSLLHGEAISIGMVMAFDLSRRRGHCDDKVFERVKAHLKTIGLPVKIKHMDNSIKHSAEEIRDLMYSDKKVKNDKIGFILVNGIGEAFQTYDVMEENLLAVIKESGFLVFGRGCSCPSYFIRFLFRI